MNLICFYDALRCFSIQETLTAASLGKHEGFSVIGLHNKLTVHQFWTRMMYLQKAVFSDMTILEPAVIKLTLSSYLA
jgi:hypothetical protein